MKSRNQCRACYIQQETEFEAKRKKDLYEKNSWPLKPNMKYKPHQGYLC